MTWHDVHKRKTKRQTTKQTDKQPLHTYMNCTTLHDAQLYGIPTYITTTTQREKTTHRITQHTASSGLIVMIRRFTEDNTTIRRNKNTMLGYIA